MGRAWETGPGLWRLVISVGLPPTKDTADVDFTAYVAARQASLLDAAMLTGCSTTDTEKMVQTALLGCHVRWTKVKVVRDVDAYVQRTLFNAIKKSRKRRWWAEFSTRGAVFDVSQSRRRWAIPKPFSCSVTHSQDSVQYWYFATTYT